MAKHNVPEAVQRRFLGENARRLYAIDPVLVVKDRPKDYRPAILPWSAAAQPGPPALPFALHPAMIRINQY